MIKKAAFMITGAILAVITSLTYFGNNQNNVCKTFQDYYTNRDKNENCYHNPDYKLEVPDIIRRKEYPVSVHQVTTDDGYILTLFRIPEGKKSSNLHKKPVLLQHGLNQNSASFVNNGNNSLAFVLAEAGYDVWLGNFRGTMYSKGHERLNPSEATFWNFTLHEYGDDIRTQVNYIKSVTKQKVAVVGYSVGGTATLLYGATFPEESEQNIETLISLAPVVYTKETRVLLYLTTICPYFYSNRTGGDYAIPYISQDLIKRVCLPYPFQFKTCLWFTMQISGSNFEQSNPETLPITLVQNYDFTSFHIATHYNQLGLADKFKRFDYGKEQNQLLYNSTEPPEYEFSKIRFSNYLVRAPNDLLATKLNMDRLYEELSDNIEKERYTIKNENFNHYDILTGIGARTLLYDKIIKYLDDIV